ncbi:MAG: hypothetical protein WCA24_11430, partial [Thiomonas sp.]
MTRQQRQIFFPHDQSEVWVGWFREKCLCKTVLPSRTTASPMILTSLMALSRIIDARVEVDAVES